MNSDIFFSKKSAIERCLHRIGEERAADPQALLNQTRQDAIVLNLQRACETAIDLAMHVVSTKKLGLPGTSREAFQLLVAASLITADLGDRMKKMVGFRNIAVHSYQELDPQILQHILDDRLGDFRAFLKALEPLFPPVP